VDGFGTPGASLRYLFYFTPVVTGVFDVQRVTINYFPAITTITTLAYTGGLSKTNIAGGFNLVSGSSSCNADFVLSGGVVTATLVSPYTANTCNIVIGVGHITLNGYTNINSVTLTFTVAAVTPVIATDPVLWNVRSFSAPMGTTVAVRWVLFYCWPCY
jgi:hypothetical protein